MSVTLKEITDASKVSISTASRALSGHAGINGTTVERVRLVAEWMRLRTYPRRHGSSETTCPNAQWITPKSRKYGFRTR